MSDGFLKEAVADEVYGKELENGFAVIGVFGLFALTQLEKITLLELLVPCLSFAIFLKFPSLRKMVSKGDQDE